MSKQAPVAKIQSAAPGIVAGGVVLARSGALEVRLAATQAEIRAALKLRYRVFCEEMGADPQTAHPQYGIETDRFDAWCDHIIVCDTDLTTLDGHPLVVGTYRALRPENAREGFYSQTEFDLTGLLTRQSHLNFCEVGRSCVAASHRTTRTIEALWCGLWAYACRNDIDVYFGAASFHGTDPRVHALALSFLHTRIGAPDGWAVHAHPHMAVAMDMLPAQAIDRQSALRSMPSLIRGYLRVNAYVGLSACVDRAFGTTDVMIVAPLDRIPGAYRRRFLAATGLDRA